jgi:haloalkane dehalogenase
MTRHRLCRSFDEFVKEHPGRDLDLGGLRYHYLDEGEGEPVLMVHGNPTWSFYYRALVAGLRGSYRTIVPDQIGCGLSDKPDDSRYNYTLERRIDDLEALVAHLGLDDHGAGNGNGGLTLVVHDWGGAIGLGYATRHPGQVGRLVILNTAAFHLPGGKAFPWPLWLCRDTPLGAGLVRGLNAFCRGTARIGCTRRPLPRELRDAYCAPYDSWDHRIAIHRFVQDIPLRRGDRSYDVLTRIQDGLAGLAGVPTLIAWGMQDFVFDHHFLAEWIRRFPGAEVHRFAQAGHYVLEDEGEQIVPLVRAFLSAHPVLREVG